MAAKIAYETKEELKREEQEMIEAKSSLKTFLLSNEVSVSSRYICSCVTLVIKYL